MAGMETESQLRIDRLLSLMGARDWTSADLSRRSNTSESVVSLALSGKRNPSVPTLVQWATALGCSLDYLVGISDNPRPAFGPEPPPGGSEMLEVMRRMYPGSATQLLAVARALLAAQESAEDEALRSLRVAIESIGGDEARAILDETLRLVGQGRGLDGAALVEGYLARFDHGKRAEQTRKQAGSKV